MLYPELDAAAPRLYPRQGACLLAGRRLGVLHGNIALDGCIREDGRRGREHLKFSGRARVFETRTRRQQAFWRPDRGRRRSGHRYEGPKGGPRYAGDAVPDLVPEIERLGKACALLTDGRFSGGTSGLSIGHASRQQPVAVRSAGAGRRPHRDRHPEPQHQTGDLRCRTGTSAVSRWKPKASKHGSLSQSVLVKCRLRCVPMRRW